MEARPCAGSRKGHVMTDAAHTGGVGDELRPRVDPEVVERLMVDAGEEA